MDNTTGSYLWPTRQLTPALALTALLLVVSACGASEDNAAPADSEPTATTSAEQNADSDDAEAAETSSPASAADDEETNEASEMVITISDYEYEVPGTIAPGSEVTVRNDDSVAHTVTADEEGLFDVSVGGGEEVSFTVPEEPGDYSFFCRPHPNMTGTLVIG